MTSTDWQNKGIVTSGFVDGSILRTPLSRQQSHKALLGYAAIALLSDRGPYLQGFYRKADSIAQQICTLWPINTLLWNVNDEIAQQTNLAWTVYILISTHFLNLINIQTMGLCCFRYCEDMRTHVHSNLVRQLLWTRTCFVFGMFGSCHVSQGPWQIGKRHQAANMHDLSTCRQTVYNKYESIGGMVTIHVLQQPNYDTTHTHLGRYSLEK